MVLKLWGHEIQIEHEQTYFRHVQKKLNKLNEPKIANATNKQSKDVRWLKGDENKARIAIQRNCNKDHQSTNIRQL